MEIEKGSIESSIKVAVRVRPMFEFEKRLIKNYERVKILNCEENVISLLDPNDGKSGRFEKVYEKYTFGFDSVFDWSVENKTV
jgi:hypothetical protein